MKKFLLILTAALLACACSSQKDYAAYVNPFIGTAGHGHTFPGATVPNGMVQLSPDSRMGGWDACSGYHYSDSTIIGFSHIHLSGTGCGDYGELLFMPVVSQPAMVRGDEHNTASGYISKFRHETESAAPGYYSVLLEDYGVKAELTATPRAGMHRYTFPETEEAAVIVDLSHNLQFFENVELELNVVSDRALSGFRRTRGWANDQYMYFYAEFSKPFELEVYQDLQKVSGEHFAAKDLRARLNYAMEAGEELLVKVGLSAVDEEGARQNVMAEIPGWDFDKTVKAARQAWNEKLATVDVETENEDNKTIFYTAMYHSMIAPNLYSDVDGRYRGQDHQVHQMEQGNYYTVFSLWDTFRALHPLLTIINPAVNEEFVNTLLNKHDEGGILPMWDLASCYTGCMIGYHAVSVIVEACLKGASTVDMERALEACLNASVYKRYDENEAKGIRSQAPLPYGVDFKNTLGFVPSDRENESVAKALEYCYNDWCIALLAKKLGKMDIYEQYMDLADNYKTYFDPDTHFMRGVNMDGSWRTPFDPRHSNHRSDDYCEGNAWQWTWFVPHDVDGLVSLFGGKEPFEQKLDSLFTISSELTGSEISADISGLVGQYAHGNEPSHHITHLYNYIGEGWKTSAVVDHILKTLYFNNENGLAGNEDCGQMSAWYVLNAIGFYPIAPASCEYSFGRPIFDKVTIRPVGSKESTRIVVLNNSPENKYIKTLKVNGVLRDRKFISHDELMAGAEVEIEMTDVYQK